MFSIVSTLLRFFSPSVIKKILEYVFDMNDLDYKMDALVERVDKLKKQNKEK